jgi:hypothetical protein
MVEAARHTMCVQPLFQMKSDHPDDCEVCSPSRIVPNPFATALFGSFWDFDTSGLPWRWNPWEPVWHRPVWEQVPHAYLPDGVTAFECSYLLENGTGRCEAIAFAYDTPAPVGDEEHCCFVEGGDPGPLFGTPVGR